MTWQNVQIKSEKRTPFGGIFSIMELFNALLAQTIDSTCRQNELLTGQLKFGQEYDFDFDQWWQGTHLR